MLNDSYGPRIHPEELPSSRRSVLHAATPTKYGCSLFQYVAFAAQGISQNAGLVKHAKEPTEQLKGITPVFAKLEISNPQPMRQEGTTQEFLDNWNALPSLKSHGMFIQINL